MSFLLNKNPKNKLHLYILILAAMLTLLVIFLKFNFKDTKNKSQYNNKSKIKIVALGDIACDTESTLKNLTTKDLNLCQHKRVIDKIINENPDYIILLGDLVYPYGSYKNYTESFKPLWQDLLLNSKAKFIITPGNHDYYKNNLEDYNLALKDTFGDRLISPTNSDFSSYQIVETNWQILNFNSNCEYTIGGCNQDSNQYQDISKELINSNKPCSIAIWHHPIFNNGRHISKENTSRMQAIYSELSKYNTEIILNGHDHNYQHFRDQDISTFIIGTGGVSLYPVNKNGSYLNMSYSFVDFGYLVLNLSEDEYRSYFQQVDGRIYDYNIKKCF